MSFICKPTLGKLLDNCIVAKTRKIKSNTRLLTAWETEILELMEDNGVEIIKPATVLKYECDHCGCVFRIKQYLCDWTELYPKIFDYTAKCPECKRVCTNYDDEV